MTLERAIEYLEYHNRWRTGDDIEPLPPATLTEAIDTVVHWYKNIHKA